MRTFSKYLAVFLSFFISFMHPLALLATEVATSTSATAFTESSLTTEIPSTFLFTIDMYNGISDDQVRMLQIFLNSDSRTIVNKTGPGSPGNETTYFGNATQDAVNRFQTIYKSVILDPIGFSSPTGTIGPRSRSVLNKILDNLRNNRPSDTNVFVGTVVINTDSSTIGTTQNNNLFQTVQTSTTTNATTSTSTSTSPATLDITTTLVPVATVGTPYITNIQGVGGNGSYNWDVLYGSLPNGIGVRSSTCLQTPCNTAVLLYGTPTSAGSYTFIIRLTSGNQVVTREIVLSITDRPGTVTQSANTPTNTNTTPTTPTNSSSNSTNASATTSRSNIGAALGILGGAIAVSSIASSLSNSGSSAGSSGSSASGSAGSGLRTVFGGRITYVQYCTCTDFILLFIYDVDVKSIIQLLYIPGLSTLHTDYNVFQSGPQVLGGYINGSIPCWIIAGDDCAQFGNPIGYIDTLRGVGTSAQ